MKIIQLPNAALDLEEAAGFIGKDRLSAAYRFLEAAEAAYERLGQFPHIGSFRPFGSPRLHGIRMWSIPGFEKFLIFYRVTDSAVEILRVLHSAREIDKIIEQEGG